MSVERWRQLAHAKAREADREVIAEHPSSTLDATAHHRSRPRGDLWPDPRHREPAHRSGLHRLHGRPAGRRAVRPRRHRRGTAPPDEPAGLPARSASRRREEIEPDGSLPITIRVEDRRPRTIGVGATLSTIDGVGVSAFWVHRNLMGRAEQLRFDAGVDGLGGSLEPRRLRLQSRRHLHAAGRLQPGHQLRHLARRTAGRLRHLPRALDHRGSRVQPHVRRSADRKHFRRDLAGPLRGRLRRPPLHDLRAGGHRAVRPARRSARRHPRLLSRCVRRAALRGGVRQPGAAGDARGARLPGLRRGAPGRARRPRQARQLPRARCGGKPARHAVLRRRRRVGPRLSLPLDRRRYHRHARRRGLRDLRRRRRRSVRDVGRDPLPDRRALRRGRIRRHRARHREPGALRRDTPSRPAPGSGSATIPGSASCASTWRRRCSRTRTTRPSRSTSASDRRFEAASRHARRARAGGNHRARAGRVRRQRQRLPFEPAREPAFHPRPADPSVGRLGRAVLAGANPAHHHLGCARRLARDRQRRARLEPARAASRPRLGEPAERRAHRLAAAGRDAGAACEPAAPGRGQALHPARAAGVDPDRRAAGSHDQLQRERLRPGGGARARRVAEPYARRARHQARHPAP